MAIKPVTVTQLNEYISRILATDPIIGNVSVIGEISDLKYHSSGHIYFSIIDGNSKINCFVPKDYAEVLAFKIEDGMEVTLVGFVSVFTKNGTYSIFVKDIDFGGNGNLSIKFDKLKQKLASEGLFDKSHKKSIPVFPKKIGIITSQTGAAVKDIIKIVKLRNNFVDIIIFPVLVQGAAAAQDISSMIDFVNDTYIDIDTLIVGRGGGSTDDLWAFNEEIVARSIYNSRIPLISAVGHEIDFTISDLVADLRAETPTAAAQLAVQDLSVIISNMNDLMDNLKVQLNNKFMYNKLLADNNIKNISIDIMDRINLNYTNIEKFKLLLEENNPDKILEKGYSILADSRKNVINSISSINVDNEYEITLKDGFANCIITKTRSRKIEK